MDKYDQHTEKEVEKERERERERGKKYQRGEKKGGWMMGFDSPGDYVGGRHPIRVASTNLVARKAWMVSMRPSSPIGPTIAAIRRRERNRNPKEEKKTQRRPTFSIYDEEEHAPSIFSWQSITKKIRKKKSF